MKNKLLLTIITLSFTVLGYSQSEKLWSRHEATTNSKMILNKGVARLSFPKKFDLYDLNVEPLRQILFSSRQSLNSKQGVVISLPNVNGELEEFEMFEASNFESDLQARFPEIRAYSGKGITDKYATLKLSISPQGIQTMVYRTDKENEFIEPYSQDGAVYAVFNSNREKGKLPWTCSTEDANLVNDIKTQVPNTFKSSLGQLKTMRLAQSCNGEYSNYFGATSASQVSLVLAAFNATLTRCNGVYEKDLGLHLNLIAASTDVIFYNPSTDPYTTLGSWNKQLQQTLTNTASIGSGAYDIGHMFGASGGGGNAGCIGCVCVDPTGPNSLAKGSGITSPADGIPQGDNFDIDYVVHEVGHQLGGNHTFTMSNEGTGANIEVGSGVTIMAYAGITSYDVAPHSIDIFHAKSIDQIQINLASKTCPVTTSISANNATPVANAGTDYTIPKSTPFVLTGSATDANSGDALTYCWEQYDSTNTNTNAGSVASATKTTGPNWISWSPTASTKRYCPILATALANQQTTAGTGNDGINVEALSSVARTLTFRLTVRDNVAYNSSTPVVGQTAYDDMVVTVSGTAGPFTVTSQNTTGISYVGLTTQTVTWNVASTVLAPISSPTVKILLSTDNGLTFPTVLLASTNNDGTEPVSIPDGINSTNCRIKVESIGNIFYNVNTTKFTITPSLATAGFSLQDFAIYPNPNNGNFTVSFNSISSNDIKVSVFDMRGRQILNKNFQNSGLFNQTIQLDNAQTGIYLVKVQDGNSSEIKKIVIK